MPARARRYLGILLAVGTLALPSHSAPSPVVQAQPRPFLDDATANATAARQFAAVRLRLPEVAGTEPAPRSETPAPDAAASTGAKPPAPRASTPKPQPKAQPSVTVTVREGQSVWSLAIQHGTSVEAIVAANGLRSAELIRAGQRLVIPGKAAAARRQTPAAARTVTVRLRAGQTLWDLSQEYGTTVEAIAAANQLASPDRVRAGQRLQVPARATAAAPRRGVAGAAGQDVDSVTSAVRLAQAFVWPARGRLTSRFGWRARRHHDGIDIGAPRGAPITAARDGVVTFSGRYYSYGKTVIINHGSGLQTLYGHASTLLVRAGDRVSKGQVIARVGSTGRSTGPHVHFEVRVNGRPVNPMKYL